ncbi:hypothetical protein DPMN_114240 [Dreissena polymorpha]|uniref:LRRNT domain-containing protein n=1 Tax=Dreissena polymorpha TaxID=45954 RepID=A0A9D4KJT2_DREPO|nr:hypothetical protein DPMN_114240 [Dreissena polymorpha]
MISTCLTSVLALILTLCTGISRGQCPEKCNCTGLRVVCEGQQLQTIPLALPAAEYL